VKNEDRISMFNETINTPSILLSTIKTGGVGLTLIQFSVVKKRLINTINLFNSGNSFRT
jgi:hypothetical protein